MSNRDRDKHVWSHYFDVKKHGMCLDLSNSWICGADS